MDTRMILYGLKDYYANAEDTGKVIMTSALAAAAADMVGGSIPALAVPATIVACFGAVWVMYGELCKVLGIQLKANVLKLLARAAIANIAANLGGALIGLVVGMFVPGASVAASAVVTFITVYMAGYVFLQMILKMAEKSSDVHSFSDISEAEMRREVKDARITKEDMAAAKAAFDANR